MGFWGNIGNLMRDRVTNWLGIDAQYADTKQRNRISSMAINADYYFGYHRPQFKVRVGQANDNIALNFIKLVVDRSVSLMLGSGIEFDLPGEDEAPNQAYIDAVWDANRKDILLQNLARNGGMFGTCYLKIMPDKLESRDKSGTFLPRLVSLNPMHWTIETEQEDIEKVIKYIGRFTIMGVNGSEVARKQEIERVLAPDGDVVSWTVTDYVTAPNGSWMLMNDPQEWQYPFAPIVHWQNIPNPMDCYGLPDVDESAIALNDRGDFIASNISKIIRYHAHPKTWARGTGKTDKQNWGADEMVMLGGENAMVANLEMGSDLASSMAYLNTLRQALFDIAQTVDLTSITDKLGALTNFGLRVLYLDALAKLGAKREVWEDGLTDLNQRWLLLAEITPSDGGAVVWPEVLPANETEQMTADKFDLEMGLVSKQTMAERRGYDFESESELIAGEKAQGDNIGAQILRAFNSGQ